AAVAGPLDDEVGDERDGFGVVELDAALQPLAGDDRGHGDQKLVLFAWGEIHVRSYKDQRRGRLPAPESDVMMGMTSRLSARPEDASSRTTSLSPVRLMPTPGGAGGNRAARASASGPI